QVRSAEVAIDFAKGTTWNKEALSGRLSARIVNEAKPVPAAGQEPGSSGARTGGQSGTAAEAEGDARVQVETAIDQPLWTGLQLAAVDMDLRLGSNHLKADGSLGASDSRLKLDLAAPELAAFWPA